MAPNFPPATGTLEDARRGGMGRRFADEASLVTPAEDAALRNFWYPVHFIGKLEKGDANTVFTLFGERWELVKADAVGLAAARDAIRLPGEADRVSADGWVCRAVDGDATRHRAVGVRDGLLMVWPGTCEPDEELPGTFEPPEGYTVHAELIIEDVPVEHGLLMENLLDLAHAPFTHTGTFAKGWGVPTFVEFVTKQMRKPGDGWHDMANALGMSKGIPGQQGSWNPYPIDMKFVTPCMVDSHIGMSQAGAAGGGAQFEEGVACAECSNHLHQLARVPALGTRAHAAALPHVARLRRVGQVRARHRARVDGDGEPGAGRRPQAGDGAAGPDAAGGAGVGAPRGVR